MQLVQIIAVVMLLGAAPPAPAPEPPQPDVLVPLTDMPDVRKT